MRLPTTIIALALLVVPAAEARVAPDRDLTAGGSPLSLENGRGTATVRSREGSILGSVRRGRVRAVNGHVRGCEKRRRVTRRIVVCTGRDLTFWATGRRWTVTVSGIGINASGVLKGSLTLQGTRGTYSLEPGGGDARPWPRYRRTMAIG